ncbi:hypothetical protein ACIHFE_34035 [Streptomyces sp. NPDC052396]|uniref:hypothetical protein n=1 Tax=Streptomyces sp. NPDC052396 TaxID=3365689 RepID=UPI0037D2D33B
MTTTPRPSPREGTCLASVALALPALLLTAIGRPAGAALAFLAATTALLCGLAAADTPDGLSARDRGMAIAGLVLAAAALIISLGELAHFTSLLP